MAKITRWEICKEKGAKKNRKVLAPFSTKPDEGNLRNWLLEKHGVGTYWLYSYAGNKQDPASPVPVVVEPSFASVESVERITSDVPHLPSERSFIEQLREVSEIKKLLGMNENSSNSFSKIEQLLIKISDDINDLKDSIEDLEETVSTKIIDADLVQGFLSGMLSGASGKVPGAAQPQQGE